MEKEKSDEEAKKNKRIGIEKTDPCIYGGG
jgi:hypothetical protein